MNATDPIDQPPLYARTDKRGVVQAANSAFFQASGHDSAQILGAPHRLLRHPAMPRAVSTQMWRMLADDIPVGVYARDLDANGSCYWVCGIVVPIPAGHVSVWVPPRSPRFDTMAAIYAGLQAVEGAAADDDAELAALNAELRQAGFADYADFMQAAIVAEVGAIPAVRNLAARTGHVDRLVALQHKLRQLEAAQEDLLATFRTLYLVPTNMRILASRLEPAGGPVSAISESYKRTAAELMQRLQGGGGPQNRTTCLLTAQVDFSMFEAFGTRLLCLAAAQLQGQPSESDLLLGLCATGDEGRVAKMEEVAAQVGRVRRDAESFQRLMAGLDQVRILGEIESGRLRGDDGGLAAIMSQLSDFHRRIRDSLTAMITLTAQMDVWG